MNHPRESRQPSPYHQDRHQSYSSQERVGSFGQAPYHYNEGSAVVGGARGQGAGFHDGNLIQAAGYLDHLDPGNHLGPGYGTHLISMANDPPLSLAPHKFEEVEILQDKPLGSGSYGSVYRARYENTLTCAAKVIHQTLLIGDPDAKSPLGRFRQECEMLSSLRHPNVVQYLGTRVDAKNNLMLLMELMDHSLTEFLQTSAAPLPFHTQVNICHDISLALSFLHSKDIVHRDLSSNNVLMIGDRRAKVTDFGMAKWRVRETQHTACPGTKVYMPPEALDEGCAVYTSSIDCFSLGVLAIQILTQRFPAPGSRQYWSYPRDDPHRAVVEEVSEIDCRKNDIDTIDPDNRILLVAKLCLSSNPQLRPDTRSLSLEFESMKGRGEYYNRGGVSHGRAMSELEQALSAQREEVERLRREENEKSRRVENQRTVP